MEPTDMDGWERHVEDRRRQRGERGKKLKAVLWFVANCIISAFAYVVYRVLGLVK